MANKHSFSSPLIARAAAIPDFAWATFWEAALILIAGATAWAAGNPWLFSSLGPTAYELAEKPALRSARPYNAIMGHLVGIGGGFAGVAIVGAWSAPAVNAHTFVTPARLWASVLAVLITTALNLLLRSGQPAALATTLLVSLGAMQTAYAALWLAVGVVIIAVVGEPVRRVRLSVKQLTSGSEEHPLQPPKAA